jgi:membrane-associated phospholipid phosphatase
MMNQGTIWPEAIGLLIFMEGVLTLPCYAMPQQENTSPPAFESRALPSADGPPEMEESRRRQQDGDSPSEDNVVGVSFLKNLLEDQRDIWTSPFRLHWGDATWLLPMAEVTGGLIATDEAASRALSNDPATLNRYRTFSNYGLYSFVGAAGGLYLWGKITHDDHKREAGLLAAEAILDSLAVNSAIQYTFRREAPYQDEGKGSFFQNGTSFPSNHSAIAWSAASVIAHEYPGPLTDLLAYGGAAAISVSRVMGKEHFPSDVVVGASIGWLIGHEVYRKRHDPELGGAGWEDLWGGLGAEQSRNRHQMGSPFVPLDSWVYPALDRLAALGYIVTSIEGLKPWTRIECARLTEEAWESLAAGTPISNEAAGLVDRLEREFAYETDRLSGGRNLTANLDSLYARTISISGPDLNNSYHFGQTVSYDFGRPFEQGTNAEAGGAVYANAGALTIYVREEYQHAPSAPPLPAAARDFIGAVDSLPVPPDTPTAAINRPELLDAYLGVNLNNFEIIVGRQSLSWGPGPGGSLMWSDNIEPVGMVRLVTPEPFHLPGFLRYLGPARVDQFFGRLAGHTFVREPFIYGQKINFKPIPALELGFSRTTIIGGQGPNAAPLTLGNFFNSLFGIASVDHSVPGGSSSSMDWTFNVPHVRNYLVFYGELYARDNIQPLQNPSWMAFRPGIYITHFPKLSKLDLHLEVASTESPGRNGDEGHLNYYDFQYTEGWTNDGDLIGNTVGRMGEVYQGWLTYWISPRSTLELTYKNNRVDPAFVPGGGAWQDYGLSHEMYLKSGFYLKSQFQYENISHYPILFHGPQRNITAILEAGFMPGRNR